MLLLLQLLFVACFATVDPIGLCILLIMLVVVLIRAGNITGSVLVLLFVLVYSPSSFYHYVTFHFCYCLFSLWPSTFIIVITIITMIVITAALSIGNGTRTTVFGFPQGLRIGPIYRVPRRWP